LNVLHVTQPTEAGVAHVVYALARRQAAMGWNVTVASPSDEEFRSKIVAAGVSHLHWQAQRSPGRSIFGETRSLKRLIREVRPDVVHLHSSKAGLAGRLAVRGRIPTLFQPHGWSFKAAEGLMRRPSVAWESAASRWTSAVICVSSQEELEGRAARVSAPMELIANGIDLDRWTYAPAAERAQARQKLGLSSEPLVVSVGRLSVQKGQDLLIELWPLVLEVHPTAQLALIGDGPSRQQLEAQAKGVAGVTFLGNRSDVREWLIASNVVVMPSRWEGLALTALEAAATGRALITTNVAGMLEVLGDPPAASAYLDLQRPDFRRAFADGVNSRLGDPQAADAEGLELRSRCERIFSETEMAARIAELTQAQLATVVNHGAQAG
jgi:glycosyltransferase involved in cell wall biosynthesis